ncbi:General transcription factor 3C polypeptide [Echinococcus granulosus]|uniref:General transcription factor 3C polypeptide n=1 Tax=Echinococcus granulosus TaxID=6210 RepID=W6UI19_ECHGR|nr:General transcription factor 3C polypeptide [Echinococcus granulosus]EUB61130.1 General transcription factor 3C polypeptide [Echinococcus granulosus]
MHFLNIVSDEICAAGLDGIPITHLWKVLEEPLVHFPLRIDADTKEFLWDKIRRFKNFDFYVRTKEPPPYIFFDRFESLGENLCDDSPPTIEKKLYPVDGGDVYGSCADYKTRQCVNSELLTEDITYDMALKRWGDRLVVVASQSLRTLFLTGSETLHSSINAKLYRILELVAKSRYNGIPISGHDGILSYGESSSTVFYIRKLFSADGLIKSQRFSMGRRSFMRIVKFGVQQGCLKVIHVPFGTACALINSSDGDSGEVCAEMLRKEAAELSILDSSHSPSSLPEPTGRRYVREAAVIYLQHPFDIEKYMIEAHVNRGSRPDSVAPLPEETQTDNTLVLDEPLFGDEGGLVTGEESDVFDCAPYYAPRINGEESFCVQICRFLCESEEKSNSQLAVHFNTSHKLVSRYADALAGIGKLVTSKVSIGTTRRYITEKESMELLQAQRDNQRQQRKLFILESLEARKVFPSLLDLRARIWAHEEAKGLKGRMDRKSLGRIIDDLVQERRIKFIDMEIIGRRHDGAPRKVDLKLVCHPSVETDSPELIDCLMAEKKRYMLAPRSYGALRPEEALATVDDDENQETPSVATTANISLDLALTKRDLELIRLPDRNVSKLRRRCLLHRFIFYLLNDLPANAQAIPTSPEPWARVYSVESVMYRYVPPVPRNTAVPGWITFHDVIQAMPLGLFLALAAPITAPRLLLQWLSVLKDGESNLRAVIKRLISRQVEQAEGFSPYRGKASVTPDALRRFELLRTPMRTCPVPGGYSGGLYTWLMSRYNVTRIYAVVEQLSGHGLVTLNGQSTQGHLPMANIYLHHRAALLDTRFASPAHHILSDISACPPPLTYEFRTMADVDGYWLNLRAILLFTPYGFTRFADPSITQFMDTRAPILSVSRLRDVLPTDENTTEPPSLPTLIPTTLKMPAMVTNSSAVTAVLRAVDMDESKPTQFILRGVGGLHASLYLFKAPFEEIGYGTTDQGQCTQYTPQYPSPNLQLQPVMRGPELKAILGAFEPGIRTVGDGAFWPWTVQMFFDVKPVIELQPPPLLPAWLFSTRARRFPFHIDQTGSRPGPGSKDRHHGKAPRRRHRKRRRVTRSTSKSSSPSATSSSDHSATSRSSTSSSSSFEDNLQSSPFEELQPITRSRKRRLQKKTTIPHIHRSAFSRRIISSDKRALDERDVEIRNSLHAKRASWNKLEDQVLLTCRVASLFLVGHTREYVCIPYVIVRDILHEYFPLESHDKTSLACARRLKFLLMLRNDERTRTDILLTKVSSDPELLTKYNIGKTAWIHLYNRDARQAHQLFKDLVRLIIRNFVPDLCNRCAHVVNKSLVIPTAGVAESEDAEARTSLRLSSVRKLLLHPREALRARYDFILLASIHNDQGLPDIGQSRPAIVVETLRNLFLGSIRFRPEAQRPHDSVLFNRILKQYPYEQMSGAVKCLASTDSLRKHKSSEDCDLNIAGQFRVKTTLRLSSWCNVQMFIYIRFFMEAWKLYKQFSEAARRLRGRQRRQKVKQLEAPPSSPQQPLLSEWLVAKHEFSEPTSGGLVATFVELLYSKSQVKLRVRFDMSCISILRKPCMSLEDRKRHLQSGSEEERKSLAPKLVRKGTPPHFGESTHIGMTVALLEGVDGSNAASTITDSLMDILLEGVGGVGERTVKGKTPRIDIRLSLNGGSVEAVAPSTQTHITVVDGEPEHKKICRRALAKFTAPLNWDAASARKITSESFTSKSTDNAPATADDRSSRVLEFIFVAGDLGRTFDQMQDRFSDSKATSHVLHRLMDEQKIFMLGLAEPRYVHWAHLRLWLVHVKDPKSHHQQSCNQQQQQQDRNSSDSKIMTPSKGEEEGPRRRRLTLAVNSVSLEALERSSESPLPIISNSCTDAATEKAPLDQTTSERTDYFFIPQPWICESGSIKPCFFIHLLLSICSMISRFSGAPMDVLATQYRHILSPVSFRLLCHLLHDTKVIRVTRVVYSKRCTIFSKPEPVICLGDHLLLAPSAELSVALEAHFVSRMNTLVTCAAELFGLPTPDSAELAAAPYVQFARCRLPRDATVLRPQDSGPATNLTS